MMRSFCVGLTGGIASGKSAAADLFAALGAEVVDTDRIARDLTGPGGAALGDIVAAFGPQVLDAWGGLDRRAMRARVFAQTEDRRRLEAILHPLIRAEARRRVEASTTAYVLLVVPLLVETGQYDELCDRVLVVDCEPEAQVRRASARDHTEPERIRAILAAQADRAARLARADDVINNNGNLDQLARQVDELHRKYLELAASQGNPV